MMDNASMRELNLNRDAYRTMQRELERHHRGRFALLHGGELVHLFNDRWDAYVIGTDRFGEGGFSIKKIGERPARLGAATPYAKLPLAE